jgi:transcriptional regulator with XRE-family HTH domain
MTIKKKVTKDAEKWLAAHGGPLTIASLLASERQCREISQLLFASRLGISAANLCDIEKGRKLVSPERAALFAKKLGRVEELWVEVATQDLLRSCGLRYRVRLEPLGKKRRRQVATIAYKQAQ